MIIYECVYRIKGREMKSHLPGELNIYETRDCKHRSLNKRGRLMTTDGPTPSYRKLFNYSFSFSFIM